MIWKTHLDFVTAWVSALDKFDHLAMQKSRSSVSNKYVQLSKLQYIDGAHYRELASGLGSFSLSGWLMCMKPTFWLTVKMLKKYFVLQDRSMRYAWKTININNRIAKKKKKITLKSTHHQHALPPKTKAALSCAHWLMSFKRLSLHIYT